MIATIKKYFKKKSLISKLKSNKEKNLNIGSGPDGNSKEYLGWICVDIEFLDITKESDWLAFTPGPESLDRILAEHVWEHLSDNDTLLANENCFKFLKKGGRLRLAVPDGFNIDKEYVERVKPGGSGVGSDDHKILYNYEIMKNRLMLAGFKNIQLLEYWDENGKFFANPWEVKDGHIKRSKHFDPRNQDNQLGYTSLIVDAIK